MKKTHYYFRYRLLLTLLLGSQHIYGAISSDPEQTCPTFESDSSSSSESCSTEEPYVPDAIEQEWWKSIKQEPVDILTLEKISSKYPHILSYEDDDGISALEWAVKRKHTEMMRFLLRKKPDLVNQSLSRGKTALCLATQLYDDGCSTGLGAFEAAEIGAYVVSCWLEPIERASKKKHKMPQELCRIVAKYYGCSCVPDWIYVLLDGGADCFAEGRSNQAALLCAVNKNKIPLLRLFVEKIDKEQRDTDGKLIMQEKNLEIFLKAKELVEKYSTPATSIILHFAAYHNLKNLATRCIEEKPSLIKSKDYRGCLPLHWAAGGGSLEVLELVPFLTRENVNAVDKQRMTPLHKAVQGKMSMKIKEKIIRALLKKGANPDAQDNLGNTALHYASGEGDAMIMEILLEYGADVDLQNSKRKSPLHCTLSYSLCPKGLGGCKKGNADLRVYVIPGFLRRGMGQQYIIPDLCEIIANFCDHCVCFGPYPSLLLLKYNANLTMGQVTTRQKTPLHFLARNWFEGWVEIAREIINRNPNLLEVECPEGYTPIQWTDSCDPSGEMSELFYAEKKKYLSPTQE